MDKKRVAVVGYGNIGRYVVEALEAAPDFEIAGIVRRNASVVPAEIGKYAVGGDIKELKDVDVAILATPTRKVEEYAEKILARGINPVDCRIAQAFGLYCRKERYGFDYIGRLGSG